MRYIKMGAMATIVAASVMAMAAPAAAQSMSDDTRCFLLSNAFARQAKDAKGRQLAAASLSFYMGRLDGRANAQTIAGSVTQESTRIDPRTAGPQMSQCATRMARAQQAIQNAVRAMGPHK